MRYRENQEFDVIIIGGGVIGLSIARELRQRGVERVAILEKNQSSGAEASHAAAGMLAPQSEADAADDFFRLCQQSRDLYPQFVRELFEQTQFDPELEQTGTLYAAFNEADLSEIERRFAWQKNADLPIEKLTAKEVLELEPSISPRVLGALRFPLDWQVNTHLLITSLNQNLEGSAVNKYMQRNSLDKLRRRNGGEFVRREVRAVIPEDNGKFTIKTDINDFSAHCVVIAAGAWSSQFEMPPEFKLKINVEPVRGQIISFRHHEKLFRHVVYYPRGYVVPRIYGDVLVGATVENAGFNQNPTGAGVYSLLETAFEISDKFRSLDFGKVRVGLRPRTPDGHPLLGEFPADSNLFWATGHYRNGILLAPITAKLMSDKIVDNADSPFLEIFKPSRFLSETRTK